MTPQMENANPAGVNNDAYFADISVIVCPLRGIALDRTFNRIINAKATRLPPQSSNVRFKRSAPLRLLRHAHCVRQDLQWVVSYPECQEELVAPARDRY